MVHNYRIFNSYIIQFLKTECQRIALLPMLLTALMLTAQPLCRVVQYDEEDGVPSSHLTQLLQDERGFMWFATWNGLCRYDGYDFQTFKPQVGDGCHMATDRIRNITLLPSGQILCQVDEDFYMFDKVSCRFRDLTAKERRQATDWQQQYLQSRSLRKPQGYSWTDSHQTQWTLNGDGRLTYLNAESSQAVDYPLSMKFKTLTFALADNRGNLWAFDYGQIYKFCTDMQRNKRMDIEPKAEVKCLFGDRNDRYWVATKEDEVVRVYSQSDDRLLGFLGSDGRLHQGYVRFGAAVYCMHQSQDGTLWLGTKPQGIFRLRPAGTGGFHIDHLTTLPHQDVYHLAEDRFGRLWVATLGGGVYYTGEPQAERPVFMMPRHYPKKSCPRARFFYVTQDDILLIATSNGLLTTRLLPNADDMHFQQHQREADRRQSLSCSATMDVIQDAQGRYYVSTESGGVNQIMDNNLLAPQLSFRHFREQFHVQPNDIVQSMGAMQGGGLMAVGSHLITVIDSTLQGRVMDASYFQASYRFSEARPLSLGQGRWLFGLTDGALLMSEKQMLRQAYTPRLVLTNIEVRGQKAGVKSLWGAEHLDTLTLQPHERSITIHFAALDYQDPERISYSFQLLNTSSDSTEWNYIGRDRSATLLDLAPDTYVLEVRSTNADGEWQDNVRRLTIVVQPTFWESTIGRLLIVLLILASICAIVYTLLYIRRIKRKQHETLEAYLALIEEAGEMSQSLGKSSLEMGIKRNEQGTSDPILQRVMRFVEENLSNSEVGVGDMAEAAATSRSGLQRKLKQTMGITPQDLMKEARIKRACQLLQATDKTVAEVAYACGFTDPKYFSRCFKQSTGKSPSEYREG